MANGFANMKVIQRSQGQTAICAAAYNSRSSIYHDGEGQTFNFTRKSHDHAFGAILLPEGNSDNLKKPEKLWNEAVKAEKRINSQEAKQLLLALPKEEDISLDDKIKLATDFVNEHFVSKGVAVQVDIHKPHQGKDNWHAHILITTRRLKNDVFTEKARDLNPKFIDGRVSENQLWQHFWRNHQNQQFEEWGLDLRVDPFAPVGRERVHDYHYRHETERSVTAFQTQQEEIAQKVNDPDIALKSLTKGQATFTEFEINRYFEKFSDGHDAAVLKQAFFDNPNLVPLFHENGQFSGLFTSQEIRQSEQSADLTAKLLKVKQSFAVAEPAKAQIADRYKLNEGQTKAFYHATQNNGFAVIEGRAGVGKSHTMRAISEAYYGRDVLALAPTNYVANALNDDGLNAMTVHSALFRMENNKLHLGKNAVIMVDEAGMLSTDMTKQLLEAARRQGAKVILVGDSQQLASIEHGGMFEVLADRHEAVEIGQIMRQSQDWQRKASEALARGNVLQALSSYADHGFVHGRDDIETARKSLVIDWAKASSLAPEKKRFVFAYTNEEVDRLNLALRQVRIERGEIEQGRAFETKHGVANFSVNDRVIFTETDKSNGIYNGVAGNVQEMNGQNVTVRIDAGQSVTVDMANFKGLRHGYAGTIYKGQGATLDESFLLHTKHWRKSASYVALTRHREAVNIYVDKSEAKGLRQLARQLSRIEGKESSLHYHTAKNITAAQILDGAKVKAELEDIQLQLPPEARKAMYDNVDLNTLPKETLGKVTEYGKKAGDILSKASMAYVKGASTLLVYQVPGGKQAVTLARLAMKVAKVAPDLPISPVAAFDAGAEKLKAMNELLRLEDKIIKDLPKSKELGQNAKKQVEKANQYRFAASVMAAEIREKHHTAIPAHMRQKVRDLALERGGQAYRGDMAGLSKAVKSKEVLQGGPAISKRAAQSVSSAVMRSIRNGTSIASSVVSLTGVGAPLAIALKALVVGTSVASKTIGHAAKRGMNQGIGR